MRWLILLLLSMLTLGDVLQVQMSLAPGLSVKNLLLYWIVFALLARIVVSGELRAQLPALQAAFALLIGYAMASWVVAGLVIHYPRYDMIQSGISLKGLLIDPALLLFATFYALRTSDDVRAVLKGFALALTFANFITMTDVIGLTHFGLRVGDSGAEEGRVFGVFGHANDTAGLIVCLLPGIAALAVTSRHRILWWGMSLVSLAVLIMTVSRGAYVAAVLGSAWAMYACRRYLPVALMVRTALLGLLTVIVGVLLVSLLDPHMGGILRDRMLGQSTSVSADDISSGRTVIWMAAIGMMMRTPVTLLTGFGWDTYSVMPFHFVTHNHYLSLWFELGIPGLAAFLFIFGYVLVVARRALSVPGAAEMRPHLIAFIFGMLCLSIVLMFGNMLAPWPYIWIYIGVMMRAAMLTLEPAPQALPRVRAPPLAPAAHRATQASGDLRT